MFYIKIDSVLAATALGQTGKYVWCHPDLFFRVNPAGRKKKNQFEMEKRALILYLLNLIFEFFALLHFMCLLFLQCARRHFAFSFSFRSYQAISMKP